jgi:hypothetical protein
VPTAQFGRFLTPKTLTSKLTDPDADDHERRLDKILENWVED